MSITAIFKRILVLGAGLALLVAIVGGAIGYLVAGPAGLVSALVGTVIAVVFCGLTAVSVLLALRVSRGELLSGAFFGIVLGGWLVKFVAFIVLIFVIAEIDWLNRGVAFAALVAAVVGSIIIDCLVIAKSRQTVVELPVYDETEGRPAGGTRR